MGKTLMVVESPAKAKKIGAWLGADYTVLASYGHVRDLPEGKAEDGELVTGVSRDFVARYEVIERNRAHVARLKEAAKGADRIILATDPDREGEAIAWHLQELLRARNPVRVTYQEISEKAVRTALAQARTIDMNLVRAQEARRMLDRAIGYGVSPVLRRHMNEKVSAGRVQVPATRLVVDREREIRAFVSQDHYAVELEFAGGWKATWRIKPHLPAGQALWLDGAVADRVAAVRDVSVLEFEEGEEKEPPAAPFTTSTLQQEGGKQLDMQVKDVMDAAQSLYDHGLITYHRSDSPNFSAETQAEIRAYAEGRGLPPAQGPRKWKAKASAQEGHEAIRPVKMDVTEAGSTDDERALYKLIHRRALASQLAEAVYATRRARLIACETPAVNGVTPEFEAKGRLLIVKGWREVDAGDALDEGEEQDDVGMNNPVPVLQRLDRLTATGGRKVSKKTAPPHRYTQAGLVKKLEDLGIGRPSTFANIVTTILSKGSVASDAKNKKLLVPTKLGETVVDSLVGTFRFADLDFTAGVESELDQVASGHRPHTAVLAASWRQLESELEKLAGAAPVAVEYAHHCEACGKGLRRIKGANGFFWGCTGHPACKETRPDVRGKPGKKAEKSAYCCTREGCGKPLVHRKKAGKGGYDFYGCSGFPACKANYKTGKDGAPVLDKP